MKTLFLAVSLSLNAAPARAHDFWIEPSTFRPAPRSLVPVRLEVGERFRGDPVPRNEDKIESFILVGPGGEDPVVGRQGSEPAGVARIQGPGLYWIGYRSRPSPIELEAAKFERYLAEEGLERIVGLRAERGETDRPGHEIYSRCAKALLASPANASIAPGDGASKTSREPGFDRPLGFTLELVPLANPYEVVPGGHLPVRLLFRGKPLEGALVVLLHRDDADQRVTQRSDGEGRVDFQLPRSGVWLVKAVHMTTAPVDSGADWESLWASMTFELPGREEISPAR